MIKRILCIITTLSILFSMTVYAQNSTYTEHELDLSGYDTFTQMLSDIGINVPDMALDTEMTQGEYLRSLIALFGYSETVSNYNATQNVYENEINIAYSMGWISKADKEKMIYDEALTLKEAAVWMLNALGYGLKISLTGDNEENYFTEATSLKLTSGITSGWDNSISFAQMLKLFYNALGVNMLIPDMANGFYEGQNLLYEKHDIQILKGIMTANSKGALAGEACGENNIEIDSVVYGCTDENANLYLGMYVNCYVHEGVVLCVLAPKKYNKVVVVDNEDIEEIDNLRHITYIDEKDKTKKLDFEFPPYVIVNGALKIISNVQDLENLIGDNGEISAIDNDNDGLYEVLKITNYVTYVVNMINHNKRIIIDQYLPEVISLDDSKYEITVIKDGEVAEFTDIKSGDVVEIAADKEIVADDGTRSIDYENSNNITILVSSGSMGGIVNQCSAEKIVIDDIEFEFSDYFINAVRNGAIESIQPGMSGAFFINHSGKIVYVDTSINVLDKYGFLVWGGYTPETDGISVRLYTSEGDVKTFELSHKVRIDGVSYYNNEELTELSQIFFMSNGTPKIKNQLVIYRLNSEGLISYIDTALVTSENENEETCLRMDLEFYGNGTASSTLFTNGTYNSYGSVFTNGGYSNVSIKAPEGKLFVVSGFEDQEAHSNMCVSDTNGARDLYEVTSVSYFGTGDYSFDDDNCIMFYNVGDDNTAKYMVYYNPMLSDEAVRASSGSDGVAFYVSSGKTINSSDEVTDFIKVYMPGNAEEKTLICKNEEIMRNIQVTSCDGGGELKKGDIIRYSLTAKGEVNTIKRDLDFTTMYSSIKNDDEPECFSATGILSPNNYGTVIRWLGTKSDSYFTLMSRKSNWGSLTISQAAQSPIYRSSFSSAKSVLIYDVKNGEFIVGTLQDLFAANECGESASVIYVRHTVSNASIVLAYNFV